MDARACIGVLLGSIVGGCAAGVPQAAPAAATPVVASGAPSAERASEGALAELPVDGFEPSLVHVPAGAPGPWPVVVVAHGAVDAPESFCRAWVDIAGDRGVVLCPRGRPAGAKGEGGAYYFPSHVALAREAKAALLALRGRLGGAIDLDGAAWVGFSQGATMGVPIVADEASRFGRALLVEGGYDDWNLARAVAFAKSGGERVLFVCGGQHCAVPARKAAGYLERSGAAARVAYVPHAGHTYGGAIALAMRDGFGWLVAGDARWAPR